MELRVLRLVWLGTALFFTNAAHADFDYKGEGTLTFATGKTEPFNFGFKWDSERNKLTIGKQTINLDQVPESYSIALNMDQKEESMWVHEFFDNGYFQQFQWTLGEDVIKLTKKEFENPVKGNYILSLNDLDFFFVNRSATIYINFKDDGSGIDAINFMGVSKDFGTRKGPKAEGEAGDAEKGADSEDSDEDSPEGEKEKE